MHLDNLSIWCKGNDVLPKPSKCQNMTVSVLPKPSKCQNMTVSVLPKPSKCQNMTVSFLPKPSKCQNMTVSVLPKYTQVWKLLINLLIFCQLMRVRYKKGYDLLSLNIEMGVMLGLPIMHCSHPNIYLCLSFLRININKSTRY